MTFHYRVYGLCLAIEHRLEGLVLAPPGSIPDVEVVVDREDPHPEIKAWKQVHANGPDEETWGVWTADTSHGPFYRLRWGDEMEHVEFRIEKAGSVIRVWRVGGTTMGDVRALLLGLVLTCTLRARGVTCLHASVIALDGEAVMLLGPSGSGKSTTAMAFQLQGAVSIADDIGAVTEIGGRFFVLPGSPRLRIRPEAAVVLRPGPDLPRLWPDLPRRPERRYMDPPHGIAAEFPLEPVPLAAGYLLTRRDPAIARPRVEPVSRVLGLRALLSQTHATFMNPPQGPAGEFERMGRLASAVPVRFVRRGEGLDQLPALCDAIRQDAASLRCGSRQIPA